MGVQKCYSILFLYTQSQYLSISLLNKLNLFSYWWVHSTCPYILCFVCYKKRKYKINGQYSALLLFEALNLSKIAFFKPIYSKTFVFTFEFQGLQNYLCLPSNYLNFIKITPKCKKCATWFRLLNNLNSNLVTFLDRKQQIVIFCYLWLFSLSTWYMHGEFIYLMWLVYHSYAWFIVCLHY